MIIELASLSIVEQFNLPADKPTQDRLYLERCNFTTAIRQSNHVEVDGYHHHSENLCSPDITDLLIEDDVAIMRDVSDMMTASEMKEWS